jgi:hypothetical protein
VARRRPRRRRARPRRPAPAVDPGDATLAEIDRLLAQWDAAQGSGRLAEADLLKARLSAEVDAAFALVLGAARGERGQADADVGTMALAFSPRPEVTAVLAERLAEREQRLVANALIALKLRADPATPLPPVLWPATPTCAARRWRWRVPSTRRQHRAGRGAQVLAQARAAGAHRRTGSPCACTRARSASWPRAAAALQPMLDD